MCGAIDSMVELPGGVFRMGSDAHYPEERPAHKVRVGPFRIDATPVINRDFARFVAATGYITAAERPARAEDYPGADPAMLAPASVVFAQTAGPVDLRNHFQWWRYVQGADWRHPQGPDSSIADKQDHPVVHVTIADALAYAQWIGKDLPSEAEWEFAARGGREDDSEFAWGDELVPDGRYQANFWQGEFPWQNLQSDGHAGTSPVGAFPANGYGLFDMIGNVWEWTSDWYQTHDQLPGKPCCTLENPRGGSADGSADARASVAIPRRVMKGGSHLCAPNYCRRYRPAARMAQPVDTSTCHVGFRCIIRL